MFDTLALMGAGFLNALTPVNLRQVRQSAVSRFTSLFKQLGAKEVIIQFDE